jgi:hypothetical protein
VPHSVTTEYTQWQAAPAVHYTCDRCGAVRTSYSPAAAVLTHCPLAIAFGCPAAEGKTESKSIRRSLILAVRRRRHCSRIVEHLRLEGIAGR